MNYLRLSLGSAIGGVCTILIILCTLSLVRLL